ncbi:response regulator transcription factor [Levilactobacillus bambusae]|uniref:DNA-binding response regulator n=1 Tax=Levilactobacillus bambusae TaxID=2024736 RepID=A0A2V1MXU4_9LACO|nr:response regulator transcription factor [Levilactobacillus bambusae]PWF99816.1 DNA-binding response regulator [Levilactobacillus bambusae]
MTNNILLVDDEPSLTSYLEKELTFDGFNVITVHDGTTAWQTYQDHRGDWLVILLDWMLPEMDGMAILRRIRKEDDVAIIMMTARSYVSDKVTGLDNGADDYLTKPFEIEELLARIRVIQRRANKHQEPAGIYEVGPIKLIPKSRQVSQNGTPISLTQREYDLLLFLMQHPNEALTRDDLLDHVWGADFFGDQNVVDVYIGYLRNKLTPPNAESRLETVRGVGYRLRGD